MILFDNVCKQFRNSNTALDKINFKVDNGDFVFLVGPSGAGKTTILRLLISEIFPTQGSIYLDDWEINKLSKKQIPFLRRKIGFIFQDFKLLHDRTIGENIAVTLEIIGKSPDVIASKVNEVLETVHLSGKGKFFPKQLSLGEQQRIAIGRAIIGEAKIILADEPTGNLDPKNSWEILKILNNVNKSGTTVIMATHNMDIVNSLKKRVIALRNGKIFKDEKRSKYI